jgi:hypothetical protein
MTMDRITILANIPNALANEGNLERNGVCIRGIVDQLGYAGITVTRDEIVAALDAVSVSHPSCFASMPAVSTHQGPYGLEYRFRPSTEVKDATRAGINAVYGVTDTMDRTPRDHTIKGGQVVQIETVRPRAFATALGHLRARWAKNNFTVPPESTIRGWVAA